MKFLSRLTFLTVAFLNPFGFDESSKPIKLGFADCYTSRAAKVKGQPQNYVPGIVIRFLNADDKQESFAVSHVEGYVSVPLRPAKYCFEAYDKKGLQLELDPEQSRCFDIRANESVHVGIVLAAK